MKSTNVQRKTLITSCDSVRALASPLCVWGSQRCPWHTLGSCKCPQNSLSRCQIPLGSAKVRRNQTSVSKHEGSRKMLLLSLPAVSGGVLALLWQQRAEQVPAPLLTSSVPPPPTFLPPPPPPPPGQTCLSQQMLRLSSQTKTCRGAVAGSKC